MIFAFHITLISDCINFVNFLQISNFVVVVYGILGVCATFLFRNLKGTVLQVDMRVTQDLNSFGEIIAHTHCSVDEKNVG
jgi:hypothetical protein